MKPIPMSEEGDHESFLPWENQSWGLSNSDNNSPVASHEDKSAGAQGTNLQGDATKKRKRGRVEDKVSNNGEPSGELGLRKGGGESDHEMHIWTERERRKKMRTMFANLHTLLPHLPPKADKSTIVDEAVKCIKTLQQTLQKLQKQKLERLQGAILNYGYEPSMATKKNKAFDSREAFLADQASSSDLANNNSTNFPNSLSSLSQFPIMFQTWTSSNVVLNIFGNEAQISVCSTKKPGLFTAICYILEKHKIEVISAHVSSGPNQSMLMIQAQGNGGSNQMSEGFPVDEMFKQAAGEIVCWVSS